MSDKASLKSSDVQFLDVRESYPPANDVTVRYKRTGESGATQNSRDWIGLFRVGWTSNKDYHSYVWAGGLGTPADPSQSAEVVFAAANLPSESEHFYQFCYVSREGVLRGASPPFRFAVQTCAVEEEVVAGGAEMESMVVVRLKGEKEEARLEEADEVLVNTIPPSGNGDKAEEKFSVFETSVFDKISVTHLSPIGSVVPETTENARSHVGDDSARSVRDLAGTEEKEQSVEHSHAPRQSPAVVEGRSDLKAELDKERSKGKELADQLAEARVAIEQLEQERERARGHVLSQLEEEKARVMALTAQQQESRATIDGLTQELAGAKGEVEHLKAAVDILRGQLSEAERKVSAKQKELDEVKMELMYGQENITELVGALTGGNGDLPPQQQRGVGRTQGGGGGITTQSCPMCNKTFPSSEAPHIFEQHVQSHFQD